MGKTEERLQVLKMIENGTISAAEGAKLLEALDDTGDQEAGEKGTGRARWFRVRVTDMQTGKSKATVNIPVGLLDVGMRLGAKFAPDMEGIDANEVLAAIKSGARGKIVDVEDEEDGERVEIYVE